MRTAILALLGALPSTAFAVCDVDPVLGPFFTLQGAVTNCPAGSMPIVLKADVTENITVNRSVDIEGGLHTVTAAGAGPVFNVLNGTLELHDLTVTGGVSSDYGGGVRVTSGGRLTLDAVEVTGNEAPFGGGIGARGDISIVGSLIHHNEASDSGGGIASGREEARPFVAIVDSFINHNTAAEDGGGIYLFEAGMNLGTTTLNGNQATLSGGGIYGDAVETSFADTTLISISDSVLKNNVADLDGGGIAVEEGWLDMERSRVFENGSSDRGGGIYYACDGDLGVENSTISENEASEGGGLWIDGAGSQALSFLTVVDNSAGTADQILSGGTALSAEGMAVGETAAANVIDDCVVGGGTVFGSVSVDGTCVTAHPSNDTGGMGIGGTDGLYPPTAGSNLQGHVPGAFCPPSDQTGVARASPCDAGALEN